VSTSPDSASPDGTGLDGASLDGTGLDGTGLDGAGLDGTSPRDIASKRRRPTVAVPPTGPRPGRYG
jgi:hypothetical protein